MGPVRQNELTRAKKPAEELKTLETTEKCKKLGLIPFCLST